jgi:hypothetical protein
MIFQRQTTRDDSAIRLKTSPTEELVQNLVAAGLDIPEALVDQILVRGDAAVAPLGEVMLDESLWKDKGPRGWGPIHAMHLLGGLKSLQAMPYFEQFLVPDRDTDWITEDMPAILAAHGPGATESLKCIASNRQACAYNRNAAVRALCLIAHRHPVCKPKVVGFLRGFFDETVAEDHEFLCLIYDDLAGLRNPEAMDDLRKAKEKGLFTEGPFDWKSMEEIYASMEVPPTISHDDTDPMEYFSSDSLEYFKAKESGNSPDSKTSASVLTALSQEPARRPNPKPGRNQPCPCGSKKKYKKCCGSR